MDAGERRNGWLDEVPLLAVASRRTRRRLAEHVERLQLPDGATIVERGRPVHWVAVVVDGALTGGGRVWRAGEAVLLGEGLVHGTAPETIVARGQVDVALVPIRALTAAVSMDPSLGLAVARTLAGAVGAGSSVVAASAPVADAARNEATASSTVTSFGPWRR